MNRCYALENAIKHIVTLYERDTAFQYLSDVFDWNALTDL